MISFVRNSISFVRNNISFVRNIISFVRNNISFLRNIISFVRNIISFVRNNISFVRNIILFVRNNISFVRNIILFVRNNIWFVKSIISFVRNNISFVRNIISFVRNNISFVRNDLGMSLTNRVGTWVWHSLTWCGPGPVMAGIWVWHSLTGRGPGTDTHWQGGYLGLTFTDGARDLGLTLTDGAGTQSPPCQWVSDPGPRHVITQVPALSASIRPRSPSCQWVSDPGPRHVSECQTQVPALLEASPDGSFVSTVRIPIGSDFVIVVVHIQCSKLFKGMECTVLHIMVPCTIKNPWSHSK